MPIDKLSFPNRKGDISYLPLMESRILPFSFKNRVWGSKRITFRASPINIRSLTIHKYMMGSECIGYFSCLTRSHRR